MLEVLFSESAAASLSIAGRGGKYLGGATAVGVIGREIEPGEMKEMIQEAERRERQNWEEAIPLHIRREDILCFPIALSVGDIQEDGIGHKREEALEKLMGVYPREAEGAVQDMLKTGRKSLKELFRRVKEGEAVRVWVSESPDTVCGLCWLVDQLRTLGSEKLDLRWVPLPAFYSVPEGKEVLCYSDWGDVPPYQWGALSQREEKLPAAYLAGLAKRWRDLKEENAPLRAILNGRLVSAPETIYDSFILAELERQEEEFMEARVIGSVLGKYRLGIGDGWIAMRIAQWVQEGKWKAVTQAAPGDPLYNRVLRKI